MNWSDAEKKKSGIRKTLTVCAVFALWMIPLCEALKENLPLAELVLRIITGKPDRS